MDDLWDLTKHDKSENVVQKFDKIWIPYITGLYKFFVTKILEFKRKQNNKKLELKTNKKDISLSKIYSFKTEVLYVRQITV